MQMRQFILTFNSILIQCVCKCDTIEVVMCFIKNIDELKKICENEFELLRETTCCFTGHRSYKLPWCENEDDSRCVKMKTKLTAEIINAINKGYVDFISGMALGFDIICAEMILELKKEYQKIKLIGALPSRDQYKVWKQYQIERYKKVLSECDSVRCLYDTYKDNCMLERNDYMINNSSLLIALYNGKGGGTGYTVKNATKKGLNIVIINP